MVDVEEIVNEPFDTAENQDFEEIHDFAKISETDFYNIKAGLEPDFPFQEKLE